MTWVKLDDQFTDHPKVAKAGPLAAWLYVCGLTYASRFLTDGFIPAEQVRRLADVPNADELTARLVDVELWEVVEGGFRVHDWAEYNPPADKVRAKREADRLRKSGGFRTSNEGESARNPSGVAQESQRNPSVPSPYPKGTDLDPQPAATNGALRPTRRPRWWGWFECDIGRAPNPAEQQAMDAWLLRHPPPTETAVRYGLREAALRSNRSNVVPYAEKAARNAPRSPDDDLAAIPDL